MADTGKVLIRPALKDGFTMGGSTLADAQLSDEAGHKFVSSYTKCSATSGDSRGMYLKHYLTGTNSTGGGETLRAFTTVDTATIGGGVHGVHASLSFSNSGTITGLGVAARATLQVPNAALAGTSAAIMAEIYAEGSSSNNTGTMSMIRGVLSGDSTGISNLKDAFFLDLSGAQAGSGGFIDTDKTAVTGYGSIRVKCPDGVTRYIPITTGS